MLMRVNTKLEGFKIQFPIDIKRESYEPKMGSVTTANTGDVFVTINSGIGPVNTNIEHLRNGLKQTISGAIHRLIAHIAKDVMMRITQGISKDVVLKEKFVDQVLYMLKNRPN